MTWEHDDILTCWIYPMIQRYNDTEILWAIEDGGVSIFLRLRETRHGVQYSEPVKQA